jgi:hypothetical protein
VLRELSAFLADLPDVARRDFYIAEAREELVEALSQDVPIAQRDAVRDAIEQLLDYRDSGAQLDYHLCSGTSAGPARRRPFILPRARLAAQLRSSVSSSSSSAS